MISISLISTAGAAKPGGPYSQAAAVGDFVLASGQGPGGPATGPIPEDFSRPAHAVPGNLTRVLAAAGSSSDQAVKAGVYLADLKFFDERNVIDRQYFTSPHPSRTTVESQLRDILVEVDAIVMLRSPPGRDT